LWGRIWYVVATRAGAARCAPTPWLRAKRSARGNLAALSVIASVSEAIPQRYLSLRAVGEAISITFFCHSSGSWNPREVRGKFHNPVGYLLPAFAGTSPYENTTPAGRILASPTANELKHLKNKSTQTPASPESNPWTAPPMMNGWVSFGLLMIYSLIPKLL